MGQLLQTCVIREDWMLYKTEIKFKELESFLKRVKLKLVTSNPQYCTGRAVVFCVLTKWLWCSFVDTLNIFNGYQHSVSSGLKHTENIIVFKLQKGAPNSWGTSDLAHFQTLSVTLFLRSDQCGIGRLILTISEKPGKIFKGQLWLIPLMLLRISTERETRHRHPPLSYWLSVVMCCSC